MASWWQTPEFLTKYKHQSLTSRQNTALIFSIYLATFVNGYHFNAFLTDYTTDYRFHLEHNEHLCEGVPGISQLPHPMTSSSEDNLTPGTDVTMTC